jgi:hypothetical protein
MTDGGSTPATRGSLRRRLRRFVVRAVRRSRLLPSTMPDRLGQDDELAGTALRESVLVYFPDTRESLYQLRQWYGPLAKLHERHPLVVVFQDSRTARVAAAESGLRCITVARYGTLDALLARSGVKLAIYVNHSPQNFANLRFLSLVHVHLSHGDGDKGVNVSNQLKAYDFNFVAGQAGIDRAAQYTMLYDAPARTIAIGRPQLDFAPPSGSGERPAGALPTVLYAPTWEGGQPSMAYSSVATHGEAIIGALLASGRFRVVYRPHPLTGVTDDAIGVADLRLRALVEQSSAGGHRVDVGTDFSVAAAESDLLICDVSAVAVDYLPTGKPLIITTPADPGVVAAQTRLLHTVPRLAAADAARVADVVGEQLTLDPARQERLELIEYYVGDTTHGVATKRFIEACERVMDIRDRAWAEVRGRGPAGP